MIPQLHKKRLKVAFAGLLGAAFLVAVYFTANGSDVPVLKQIMNKRTSMVPKRNMGEVLIYPNGNKGITTTVPSLDSFGSSTSDFPLSNFTSVHNLENFKTTLMERMVQNSLVGERFVSRLNRLNQLCTLQPYRNIKSSVGVFEKSVISSRFLNSHLVWCHIPKIATTFLKRVNKVYTPALVKQGMKGIPLKQRKRFYLVREPYARFVSGYICKIVTAPDFWRMYGIFIISKYRPNPSNVSQNCGHDVTFSEFVKYFIVSQQDGKKRNKHFMPIHEQCHICKDQYDFIVHLETLKDDMTFVFQSVNASVDIDMRDTGSEMVNKIRSMNLKSKFKNPSCYLKCSILHTLWWSFQARGFISSDMIFPLNGEECEHISISTFEEIVVSAYKKFTDRAKRSKQKRDMMVNLYLQVPLSDRIKLKSILYKDFELFGYEPQPADVFPELINVG